MKSHEGHFSLWEWLLQPFGLLVVEEKAMTVNQQNCGRVDRKPKFTDIELDILMYLLQTIIIFVLGITFTWYTHFSVGFHGGTTLREHAAVWIDTIICFDI